MVNKWLKYKKIMCSFLFRRNDLKCRASKQINIVSRRDGPCSQSVSEVCLFVTPIRFEGVLSEPMKLQFIKGK